MANIWTPTIVQPDIPKALMTELEFLVLTKLFDHKVFEWAVDETHPNVRTILMTGERRLHEHTPVIGDEKYVYFCSEEGPPSSVELTSKEAFIAILNSWTPMPNRLCEYVKTLQHAMAQQEAPTDGDKYIELDLSMEHDAAMIFQDILKRQPRSPKPKIEYVYMIESFMCSKMSPLDFGGGVTVITADTILYKSTYDVLHELLHTLGISIQ